MTLRNTIDFLLHDWLDTTALTQRARFTAISLSADFK